MTKIKVSELPIEVQQALIQEAKQLGIGGLLTNYGVDTLKEKIAKAKAEQNGDKENGEKVDEVNQKDDKEVQADKITDETQKGEDDKKEEQKKEKAKPVSEEKAKAEAKKDTKYKICHICRSKVIDGVCTGCGYTLNP